MADKAKNLIIITMDEMRGDCAGYMGSPDCRTPNLDRLAGRGTAMMNHFAVFPKCVPTRVAAMTGRYCHTDGFRTIQQHLPNDHPDVLAALKERNYETCLFGHNHVWEGVLDGRNAPHEGYVDYHSFTDGLFQHLLERTWPPGEPARAGIEPPEAPKDYDFGYKGRIEEPLGHFCDANRAEQAIHYLREVRDRSRPFFMQLNFGWPHPAYKASEPYYSMYDREAIHAWPHELPASAPLPLRKMREIRSGPNPPEALLREIQAVYYAMITQTDAILGRVLDAIEEEGLFDNSAVIFFSDHGDFAGQYGLTEKWDTCMADCLLRVPCITPNVDALARDGLRLARCYTPNAICSPARASLMTGTYPSTHGMWDCTHTQRSEWVNVDERLAHWSQHLAGSGYAMGYFGKWHVEQTGELERFGWGEYDTNCAGMRVKAAEGTGLVLQTPGYSDSLVAGVADAGSEPVHHPAFDAGIDFIRRNAQGGPFCCFVSSSEPHDPYVPPRRFFELYDVEKTELSPTQHEQYGPEDKPQVLQRMRAVWRDFNDDDWRYVRTAYRAVVSFLDHEIGRVVEALREQGLYDDTIIVVTSDHGDLLGAHGLLTKGVGTAYEEVYNVPLVIRVPGMRRGEDARHVVGLPDLAPTLLDLCGAGPLPLCQGRSLRPVLDGTADVRQWQDAYAEFFGQRFVYTQRLIWHGSWKYIFSPGGVDELYNLDEDPHEEHNLAADPAHRRVLMQMCSRMWRKMEEIGDESLLRTHYATLRTAPVGPLRSENVERGKSNVESGT